MYQVGDLVVYGNTGVCRIREISNRPRPGFDDAQLYYTLEPLQQDCVIYAPVDGSVFMRPVITRQEALDLIDLIPTMDAEAYHNPVLRQLTEHYEAALGKHDCGELIAMTMSLYAKKQGMLERKRKFGAVDERYMKRAQDLLFGELSAVLDIPEEQVPDFIASRVETQNFPG